LVHFSFSFFLNPQHFHVGVNEWLTIRNLPSVFFKWFPIGRHGVGPGSRIGTGVRVMGVIKGNIGAAGAFNAAVVFSPQGPGSKEAAKGSLIRGRILSFAGKGFIEAPCPL
jgi:hypothetical protein